MTTQEPKHRWDAHEVHHPAAQAQERVQPHHLSRDGPEAEDDQCHEPQKGRHWLRRAGISTADSDQGREARSRRRSEQGRGPGLKVQGGRVEQGLRPQVEDSSIPEDCTAQIYTIEDVNKLQQGGSELKAD